MPDARFFPNAPLMAAKNSGSSQPIDATAYDTPNSAIEPSSPLRPPRSSLGNRTDGSTPASNAMPNTASAAPMKSENHGATSYTEFVIRLTTSPTTANVAAKPVVTATATTSALLRLARS